MKGRWPNLVTSGKNPTASQEWVRRRGNRHKGKIVSINARCPRRKGAKLVGRVEGVERKAAGENNGGKFIDAEAREGQERPALYW